MNIHRSPRELLRMDSAGDWEKARLVYVVEACPDAATAVTAVRRHAPAAYNGSTQRSVEVTSSPGGGIFEVTVTYGAASDASERRRERKAGDRLWKFAVTSRSVERRAALETVRSIYLADDAERVSPGTRIDWNGRSGLESVAGSVRALEPEFSETCRATFHASHLNTAYKRRAAAVVGKVNSAAFHHWEPGEVMLESIVQGEVYRNASGASLCDVVFRFLIRTNGSRRCAGQTVSGVDGWDYLWAVTEIHPGGTAESVSALHVSRIYERTQFNVLEL